MAAKIDRSTDASSMTEASWSAEADSISSVGTPQQEDGTLLLWAEGGVMFSINSTATFIWKKLEEKPKGLFLNQIVQHVERAYNSSTHDQVPFEQIKHDCEELMSNLEKKGVIKRDNPRDPNAKYRIVKGVLRAADKTSVSDIESKKDGVQVSEESRTSQETIEEMKRLLTPASHDPTLGLTVLDQIAEITNYKSKIHTCVAFLAFIVQDVVLKLLGFDRLCQMIRRWPLVKTNGVNTEDLLKLCAGIERARIWYPKRVVCMSHSCVITCLLRCKGIPAHMVVAGRPRPFRSHAWVEVNETVLNDTQKVKHFYRQFARY